MKRHLVILLIAWSMLALRGMADDAFTWPTRTPEMRPWTRWWWLGSAVDNENLTRQLETFHDAGLGGVEICPIYGAKGYESRYIDFLSPKWIAALDHTIVEADRLGMKVDLTTGTGWPFGGPNVPKEFSSTKISGVVASATTSPIQKVKRAAPGGQGNVLDPFSSRAMSHYLQRFDNAFKSLHHQINSEFHDSFEYYGANWTPTFFDDFQGLRGYDLHPHLHELACEGDPDTVARIKHDYRETISDLHLEYLKTWVDWSHAHHSLARNQAHGSPTNILDAYAIADIPETEIFGKPNNDDRIMLMFASSAAHIAGHTLASSESFTWLGEHFQTTLADCKPAADLLLTSGINHIFLHGIAYSPRDVQWPGWLFYASTDFAPQAGLWHDAPAFFSYITRIQSILQSSENDNDLLLYFPIHDIWQDTDGMLKPLTVHDQNTWLYPTSFYKTAKHLIDRGYTFDFISDSFLAKAEPENGKIRVGNHDYTAIIIPPTKFMPAETAEKLAQLARDGAGIIFQGALPQDVPGFKDLASRRERLNHALQSLAASRTTSPPEILREPLVDHDLHFTRRKRNTGWDYLLINPTNHEIEGWIPLAKPATAALLMDPMFQNKIGFAALRQPNTKPEIYLQLPPNSSIILRTFNRPINGPRWKYFKLSNSSTTITGSWHVHFLEGGPVIPKDFTTTSLSSWTTQDDPETKRFAGTARYSIDFTATSGEYLLNLGKVCESTRISLNGQSLATLWSAPFSLEVALRDGANHLDIEVTNSPANRIADLDRRHVQWKSFHEINFVNKDYKPFDASHWPLRDSGLLGPVTLTPLEVEDVK